MKIVLYSDIQFHPWREFSKVLSNGRNSRFEDQLNVQDEIFEYAISSNADVLIHNGDLFEALTEKIDKATFLEVFSRFVEFSKNGIVVLLLVGNHDWLDRTETSHILEPFKEIENLFVVDTPRIEVIEDVYLAFVPSTRTNFKEKVKSVLYNSSRLLRPEGELKHKYLFTHQDVEGVKVGPRDMSLKFKYTTQDFYPQEFDLVFNGHFHKPQLILDNFIIVGSSLQKDFGERNDDKGFWFLDTKEGPDAPLFVETSGPKFFKINVDKENYEKNGLKANLPPNFTDKDFLWVITDAPIAESVSDRIRLDIQSEKEFRIRSDININMAVSDQLKHYIKLKNPNLDQEKLFQIGLEKYKLSI